MFKSIKNFFAKNSDKIAKGCYVAGSVVGAAAVVGGAYIATKHYVKPVIKDGKPPTLDNQGSGTPAQ